MAIAYPGSSVPAVESEGRWTVSFIGFDSRRTAVPVYGTWRRVQTFARGLLEGGTRDVRYRYPVDYHRPELAGLEVSVSMRRPAPVAGSGLEPAAPTFELEPAGFSIRAGRV